MKKLLLLLTVYLGAVSTINAQVAVYWRGEATNGNWDWGSTCDSGSDGNWYYTDWGGNRKRPDCYGPKFIHFDNNNQTNMELNSNDDFSIIQLIFDASASNPRTINSAVSRRIFFKQGATSKIENYSAATHTLNIGLSLDNATEINPINGNLTLSGTVNNNGNAISIYGNNAKKLSISGIISGSGSFSVKQNSTVELLGINTYTGSTTIEAGTLILNNNNGALPATASITVNSGATLKISKNQTLATINLQSGSTLIIDSGATLTLTAGMISNGTLVNNGVLKLNMAGSTVNFPNGITVNAMNGLEIASGNVNLTANITPNLLTVSGGVLNLGTYTANSTSGTGTFTLSSGTLRIGGTNTLPSGFGTYNITSTSTTEYNGTSQQITIPGNQKYGNLILSGSGQKTLATNVTAANDLIIGTTTSLIVNSGKSITVDNRVINNGTASGLTIEDNAGLVQTNNVTNTGQILQYKNSNNLYRLDYTLWSSPVQGQNLQDFSTGTTASRFYEYHYGTNSGNISLSAYFHVDPVNTSFTAGKGYLIRMPNALSSITGYDAGTNPTVFTGTFTGSPNNGTITVPVSTQGDRFTSVGNPYPSPISISEFFSQNSNIITGTVYLWRKRNGTGASTYATLTSVAYTANGGGTNTANSTGGQNASGYFIGNSSNWVLAPGQGFLVQTKADAPANPVVTFNNSIRRVVPGAGQAFLRTTEGNTARMWLNITDANNAFSQAALVYTPGATTSIDYAMDGIRYTEDNIADIYTLSDTEKLAIQARPEFTSNDVVPLGFTAPQAGNYTISLDRTEGIFNNGQNIYLYDHNEGIVRNLNNNSYEFTTTAGTFDSRFEIRYTTSALGLEATQKAGIIAYKEGNNIVVNAGNTIMDVATIFDLNGRQLYNSVIQDSTFKADLTGVAQQVLILKIASKSGIISKKIVF